MKTEAIYEYLERIGNLIRTDIRRSGIAKGLQPIQVEALHDLSRCNRYSDTPMAVAEFLGLTKGTVSQTLAVLQENGLIDKQADRHDRRVVHVSLTEAGRMLVAELIPPKVITAAMATRAETDCGEVLAVLNRVLRELQKANGLRTFDACKTCRHHRWEGEGMRRCGLTSETLTDIDAERICRDHDPAAEA